MLSSGLLTSSLILQPSRQAALSGGRGSGTKNPRLCWPLTVRVGGGGSQASCPAVPPGLLRGLGPLPPCSEPAGPGAQQRIRCGRQELTLCLSPGFRVWWGEGGRGGDRGRTPGLAEAGQIQNTPRLVVSFTWPTFPEPLPQGLRNQA